VPSGSGSNQKGFAQKYKIQTTNLKQTQNANENKKHKPASAFALNFSPRLRFGICLSFVACILELMGNG